MINIVCVLKSGGDYDDWYVYKLMEGLFNNVSIDFNFYCFTDIDVKGVDTIELKLNLEGWWSKLEIFKLTEPTLYLDLDTVIVGNIDGLLQEIKDSPNSFMMITDFNSRFGPASGIMAWNGNWGWLCDSALSYKSNYAWDQYAIAMALKSQGTKIKEIIKTVHSIVSYKYHCSAGVPEGTKIICFHGNPRPHEALKDWYD